MSIKVKYIGTQQRWPELSITGKQSLWMPGQIETRDDVEGGKLLATGLFAADQVPVTAIPSGPGLEVSLGDGKFGHLSISLFGFLTPDQISAIASGTLTDVTDALTAAIAYCTANVCDLIIPPSKSYALSGSATLGIDVGRMALRCPGAAVFDCSARTGGYVFQVYSSLSYPSSHYTNTINEISGIVLIGARSAGVNGLLVGHVTNANNGQTVFRNVSVRGFDTNLEFTHNSWRTVFYNFTCSYALTYAIYAATGLTNSGEAMAFYHAMINDNTGPINVAANKMAFELHSSSILNTKVEIPGSSVRFSMIGGNIENPGATTPYRYVAVTGTTSLFSLDGTSLTINSGAAYTAPPLYVSDVSSCIYLHNVRLPDGSNFNFETDLGYRVFVEGVGRVIARGCHFQPLSGGKKAAISKSMNAVINPDFESGAVTGWTVATFGTGGSTATASAGSAKNGSYGLKVLTVASGGINVKQVLKCPPGALVLAHAWIRVQTLGGSPAGYFQVVFKDAAGATISTLSQPLSSATWAVNINSTCGYAPAGTDSVEIIINGASSASPNEIWADEVIVNIIP